MGNHINENNVDLNENPDQLIEDNANEQIQNNSMPQLKTIIKIKNPFYLLKETIHLEKDSIKNIYYIKFFYDSLINFNCYINFNVKKNTERKNLKQNEEYELCYIPTDKFVEKNIVINNLSKGRNKEFFYKEAFLDFDYLEQNSTRIKEEYEEEYEDENEEEETDNEQKNEIATENKNEENESLINNNENKQENENNINNINNENEENYEEIFDICIEFSPYHEENLEENIENKEEKNEIAFTSLFNIEKKENNDLEMKCISQKLKKHNLFFDIKDIYDGSGNNGKCIICYINNRNTIFLGCGHSCCCQQCSDTLNPKSCPLCKNVIKDIIHLNKEGKDSEAIIKNEGDDIDNTHEVISSINDLL